MSVAGYLGKGNSQLRMPKEAVDVEEQRLPYRAKPGIECYENVDDYDPVLRWHCRLSHRSV